MATLLIIDMQIGMTWPQSGVRNNPGAEAVILDLLTLWRERGTPVVHVRHISRTPNSPFYPSQQGVEFQPLLQPLEREHVVEKNVPDAFVNTGLERWLHARGQTSLVIVGVSTNNSVEATARTAGNLGFQTYVVSNGTFAFEKFDLRGILWSADDVHSLSLANLHGEYATVLSSEAALNQ